MVNEEPVHTASVCIHEWHRRFAHRNLRDIKNLKNFGLEIIKCTCQDQCDACMRGKSTEFPFEHSLKPEKRLEIIVSDLCGPLRIKSVGGSSFFLTLTDVFSDYTEVKFLKNKSEAKEHIINFIEFSKINCQKNQKYFDQMGVENT